ncbi:hypothetical protein [Bergeyella porcorum]
MNQNKELLISVKILLSVQEIAKIMILASMMLGQFTNGWIKSER